MIITQSCPTLFDPGDCSLPGSSVHGILQATTGVGCHSLLQGIFLIQGLNLGLLHCRQILYHLNHQESPSKWKSFRKRQNTYTDAEIWDRGREEEEKTYQSRRDLASLEEDG